MSNLPPGVSQRDLDKQSGDYPAECDECKQTFMAYDLNADGLCINCELESEKYIREQEQPRDRMEGEEK